jgi:DNA repair photolyase
MYGMRVSHTPLSLFPDVPPASTKRRSAGNGGVRFRPLACKTILNENPNRAYPFRWTINPYRGCQFGCPFCYARYTHGYIAHADPSTFATRIYVKFQAAQLLAETLTRARTRGGMIAIGTATDPYQPAEKRYSITRRILEVLARCPDLELSITTRSPLILRDVDLLRSIAHSSRLSINVSMITMHPHLARILEPMSPPPRRRLEMIRALASAGIETGVFVMPILPGITDSPDELRAMLRACQHEGASYAAGDMIRLFGFSWNAFAPTLRRHFPHLLSIYEDAASRGGSFADEVRRACMNGFRSARESIGLAAESGSVAAGSGHSLFFSGSLFHGGAEVGSGQVTPCKTTRSA